MSKNDSGEVELLNLANRILVANQRYVRRLVALRGSSCWFGIAANEFKNATTKSSLMICHEKSDSGSDILIN